MIDLQAEVGHSKFSIESVGINRLKYPVAIKDAVTGEIQKTTGDWEMGVSLSADQRGTHMSRFIAELEARHGDPMDLDDHVAFARVLANRLGADAAYVKTSFSWFRKVKAPKSQMAALLDTAVDFESHINARNEKILVLQVPAKALCPCSKAISDRGAHNQRSLIKASIHMNLEAQVPAISRLIALIEDAASSPVYPLLKREDEKHVTEYAYDHPVFVEDIVRHVAEKLYDLPAARKFAVEAINQESIHAHDCFARLVYDRAKNTPKNT